MTDEDMTLTRLRLTRAQVERATEKMKPPRAPRLPGEDYESFILRHLKEWGSYNSLVMAAMCGIGSVKLGKLVRDMADKGLPVAFDDGTGARDFREQFVYWTGGEPTNEGASK